MPNDRLIILKDGQFILRQYSDMALGDQQEIIDQLCGNSGHSHCGYPTGTVSVELSPSGYLMDEKVSNVSCKFWNGVISAKGQSQRRYVAVEVPFFPVHCVWGRVDTTANNILLGIGLIRGSQNELKDAEKDMHERLQEGIWLPGFSMDEATAKEWITNRVLGKPGRHALKETETANILIPTPGRTIIAASYTRQEHKTAYRSSGHNTAEEKYRIGSFMNLGADFAMDQSRCAFNEKALPLTHQELNAAEEKRREHHDRYGAVHPYAPPFPNVNNEGSLCLGHDSRKIASVINRADSTEQDIAQELLRVFMNTPCSNHWTSPATNKICALDINKIPIRASLTTDYFLEYADRTDRTLTNLEALAMVLGRKV